MIVCKKQISLKDIHRETHKINMPKSHSFLVPGVGIPTPRFVGQLMHWVKLDILEWGIAGFNSPTLQYCVHRSRVRARTAMSGACSYHSIVEPLLTPSGPCPFKKLYLDMCLFKQCKYKSVAQLGYRSWSRLPSSSPVVVRGCAGSV